MSQTDNAAAALEWIAHRCSQAQTTADYESACAQCAKLARDVLDKKNRDQQVTVRTESKAAVLAHYSDMARVARLEAVNAELVAALKWIAANGPSVGWGTRKVALEALAKAETK